MKTKSIIFCCSLLLFILINGINTLQAKTPMLPPVDKEIENFIEYKGKVVDNNSGSPLSYASLLVQGTNISTISNTDGEFSLKISRDIDNPKVQVSFIGFKNKIIALADIENDNSKIKLESSTVLLPELNVISKDANALMKAVFDKIADNYNNVPTSMTAFYRETIKKNRTYVSLAEAVVDINKQSYISSRPDVAKLYKTRKQADYDKLDTISFKLQGGPYNSLLLDIIKNPDVVFTDDMFNSYEFSFDKSTYMDNQLIYIVDFKQHEFYKEPLYFGKLYVDAKSLAIKSAVFKLNLSDRDEAASMFIIKKPFNAKVYPTEASYRIDYLEKDGKWFYGYSRIEFSLKINWKKKLFNTNYHSTIEMAVTDWSTSKELNTITSKERIRSSIIIADEATGFSDPTFWGEYNIIEPEKPIENAIRKIQKQLAD